MVMLRKLGFMILSSIGLLALLSTYVIAQNESTPVPTGYQFAYQFHPGEMLKYKITAKGGGSMGFRESDKSYYGLMTAISLPITTKSQAVINMITKGVTPEGNAEIEMKVDSTNDRMEMLGHKRDEKLANGIYEWYEDDELVFTSVTTNKPIPFLLNPIAYTINKNGKLQEFNPMKWLDNQTLEMEDGLYFLGFNDMAIQANPGLPVYRINVGDSWSSTTELKIPKLKIKPVKVVIESSFASIDTVNGKPYAIIENFWNVDVSDWKFDFFRLKEFEDILPNLKLKRLQGMMSGKVYYSLNDGKVSKGDYIQNYIAEISIRPPKISEKRDFEVLVTMYLADNVTIELME